MKERSEQAEILVQALPYIRQYYGKTVVIKYGGNAMADDSLKASVTKDIVLLRYVGMQPVVVHGGGPEITELMHKMGKEPNFIGGLRVTDAETMEIVEMVLAGKTNKSIVSLINSQGGQAVGLSGKDANLLVAEKAMPGGVDLGQVGAIVEVNTQIVRTLIDQAYIPVIASVAVGEQGESYNVNADHVAGELAGVLGAAKLITLTDVQGVYRDFSDKSSLISELSADEAQSLIESGKIDRGMIPKVESCITAVKAGVEKAHIIDGTIPHALLMEVFTDKGIGTMIS
ncbi:MAG TPA: acetylglutamate kinase [Armatimonadota bacterium]|nr:acetylglutamate kinase [Armatimonadota bacterium]